MKKYLGKDFIENKFTSLDGKVIHTLTEVSDSPNPFQLRASAKGLEIQGALEKVLDSQKDLQDFAELIAAGWENRQRLRKQILTTPSGH